MPAPLMLLLTLLLGAPLSARADDLILLLTAKSCPGCQLADADLVHADLRDADLSAADLQRANLSTARLDGADLRDADLRFSSLKGASLRGADLRGAKLDGTDLRQADLSGSQINPGALEQSHWQGAKGINVGVRSHASLHNAGVEASEAERWEEAEALFSKAIKSEPKEPLSWVARGLSRGELGRFEAAARDLAYAGHLYEQKNDFVKAEQLQAASELLRMETPSQLRNKTGTGLGSTLLGGTLSVMQSLAPIALKALVPLLP